MFAFKPCAPKQDFFYREQKKKEDEKKQNEISMPVRDLNLNR
jgi:hypothetical protein